ncbi:hypothetical protein [Bosea sp. (in: a-proteobacteria)]|uniref:hypothetical protein n=1 Tax=Bosea sp. (in: a-proteobacteria) TaxID=1871050 RepID=UPI002736989C|nr:hypothetical protein [Bosea sp. (in: a-proteobacteria)]MDP3258584.1 hypothetical protein [Bosea sp. (in: a-proteobacteria)]
MTSQFHRVLLGRKEDSEPYFTWIGWSSSRQHADEAAHDAMRSAWRFATGLKDPETILWESQIETKQNTPMDGEYQEFAEPGSVKWLISGAMKLRMEKIFNARFKGVHVNELYEAAKNILLGDISIQSIPPESTIVMVTLNQDIYSFEISISLYAHHNNEVFDLKLEDCTLFALMTLSSVFNFGDRDSPARHSFAIEAPQSSVMRAARAMDTQDNVKRAANFLRGWGAEDAADRLVSRRSDSGG